MSKSANFFPVFMFSHGQKQQQSNQVFVHWNNLFLPSSAGYVVLHFVMVFAFCGHVGFQRIRWSQNGWQAANWAKPYRAAMTSLPVSSLHKLHSMTPRWEWAAD